MRVNEVGERGQRHEKVRGGIRYVRRNFAVKT